ncbi:zinc knuckle domain protein [Penicillium bovifimosum]|uniref:Zinc knuckle domain protein n=1 Tax=Penicillium bovifimosum TaxID=126998 RepID=A0A9W9GJC5_9EURO|nr:zinc knuckle domain protein [Penicillium bovifimosum]KAJ5121345.1 zinc knuckle domain protein [Penicillium bovifimosum]
MVATGANAQTLPEKNYDPPRSMDEIAEGALRVLKHIENSGTEDPYVTGFIRSVRRYALNAQRGDGQGMAKVLEALTEINANTERLNQRVQQIETTISAPTMNPAAAWRSFRAKDQATTAAPITRDSNSPSPGVVETREDREVVVKVGGNREQIRKLTPKDLVERAEGQKTPSGHSFVAARKLPSGDVAMIANSAAGAQALRKQTAWLRAFGPGSVAQEPSWGVVAYHIPVRSMKVSPETMASIATELLAQNNWGENAKIQYLGWMTRPGERAEGSILIEFTNPVVANRAIASGVIWGRQIHHAARFCREGRIKLCRKCEKPGHIQSHCSNESRCGHCAGGHPTWECSSAKGRTTPIKCANCGEGHRPTSRECPVKTKAMEEAKQALANCPAYHRVSMHFQATTEAGRGATATRKETTQQEGIGTSVHAAE